MVNVYELWEMMSLPGFKIRRLNEFVLHLPFIILYCISGIPMVFTGEVHGVIVTRETHDKLLLLKGEISH